MIKLNQKNLKTKSKDFLSEYDIFSFFETDDLQSHKYLGNHFKEQDGQAGFNFTIWAPSAVTVSLVGDFNDWRLSSSPLSKVHDAGIWSIWLAGFKAEDKYQYAIQYSNGEIKYLCDPYATEHSLDKRMCSIATKNDDYQWHDEKWINQRENSELSNRAISIISYNLDDYCLTDGKFNFQTLAKEIVDEAKEFKASHIELLNVFESVINLASSIKKENKNISLKECFYYSTKSSFGSSEDLKCFIDHCHQNDIGVIFKLPYFQEENFPSLAHYKNLSKKPHFNFFLSNIMYWLEDFHIDGCNFGQIESLIQKQNNENIRKFICSINESVHSKTSGVFTIAEDSSGYPNLTKPVFLNGLGFNMKINLYWLNEIKKFHANKNLIDFIYSSINVFAENFVLKLDDISDFNQLDFQEIKILLGFLFTLPGKKILSNNYLDKIKAQANPQTRLLEDFYFSKATNILNFGSTTEKEMLSSYYKELNRIYTENSSLHETDFRESCFEWVSYSAQKTDNDSQVLSYLRWSRDYSQVMLIVINFSEQEQKGFRTGVPKSGFYSQIFNSQVYNEELQSIHNEDGVYSSNNEHDCRPFSLLLDLAPKSFNIFKA